MCSSADRKQLIGGWESGDRASGVNIVISPAFQQALSLSVQWDHVLTKKAQLAISGPRDSNCHRSLLAFYSACFVVIFCRWTSAPLVALALPELCGGWAWFPEGGSPPSICDKMSWFGCWEEHNDSYSVSWLMTTNLRLATTPLGKAVSPQTQVVQDDIWWYTSKDPNKYVFVLLAGTLCYMLPYYYK